MIVFITRMPESAEVTRNVMINTTLITMIACRNQPSSMNDRVVNSLAEFEAARMAPPAVPLSSRSMAVPPRIAIQAKQTSDGAMTAPMMNSRTVRPLEMRARNRPTKGENAIHQAQ